MRSTLANTFWILCLATIALFAFFWALGAFKPSDIAEVTIGVGFLLVLWIAHAVWDNRHKTGEHDPMTIRARERRGF